MKERERERERVGKERGRKTEGLRKKETEGGLSFLVLFYPLLGKL